MRITRLAYAVPIVIIMVSSCALLPLAPIHVPPSVSRRERSLDDYDDRLMDALAHVLGSHERTSSERVIVVTSSKVELILLAAGLASDWQLLGRGASIGTGLLRRSAEEHVLALRHHDAVGQLQRLRRTGFWYDALPRLALCFSDPPNVEQIYPIPEEVWRRSRAGERDLRGLMARLRSFADMVDWSTWWEQHQDAYTRAEERCRDLLKSRDILGELESYFGERLDALVIIPSAMISGGFGGTVLDPVGDWAVCCFGPATWESLPTAEYLEAVVLHEAGHAFVNHHARERPAAVMQYAYLLAPIADKMGALAYDSWETVLNEHLIRAIYARICLRWYGVSRAESVLETEERLGFRYVRLLYAKLEEYEADRTRYPDFRCFYVELLTVLRPL